MTLIHCQCAWCGFEATRFMIVGHVLPDIWICDTCAVKWKDQTYED